MKPKAIQYWPSKSDYILFMDESGTKDLNDEDYPILVLCGCLFGREEYPNLVEGFMRIKRSFWPPKGTHNGKRICFVSHSIRQRKGPFCHRSL